MSKVSKMATNTAVLPKRAAARQGSLRAFEIRWGTLFLTPWIIGFLLFTAGPMLASLYLSFTDYSLLSNKDPQWIGGRNFSDILSLQVKTLATPTQDATAV